MKVEIQPLTSVTEEVVARLNFLLSVLKGSPVLLSETHLSDIIHAENTYVWIAVSDDKIVGMLSFVLYRIPTGLKAWIEDVAVDPACQGRGVGRLLVETAIEHAKQIGVRKIDLTSNSSRVAANVLYQKLGFVKRETNFYRLIM